MNHKTTGSTVDFQFRNLPARLSLRVGSSQLSKHGRRQVLLALYRAIKPLFGGIRSVELNHDDTSLWAYCRNMERPVSLRQALRIGEPRHNEGFEIRMRRLKFGLTQLQFAKHCELSRTHLSRIEHGHIHIRPETRVRIERAFRILLKQEAQKRTSADAQEKGFEVGREGASSPSGSHTSLDFICASRKTKNIPARIGPIKTPAKPKTCNPPKSASKAMKG